MTIKVKAIDDNYLVPVKGAKRWNKFLINKVWLKGVIPKCGTNQISDVSKALQWS